MSITVIKGGIFSGKTALCMDMIEKLHKTNRCIMLVNDKYSFETEKSFIKRFGGTGLNNIDVLTFRKLADELIDTENTQYMSTAGREMLVYRSIKMYLDQNPKISSNMLRTVGKKGFVEIMSSFVGEIGNYRTTTDEIRTAADNTTDKVLKEKLSVIADIYDIYSREAQGMNYIDGNIALDMLAEKINSDKELFKGTYVFIDRFNDFLPPRWNVIKAINASAEQVYITLNISEKEDEKPLYEINRQTLEKIEEEYVIKTIEASPHLNHTRDKNKALYHLISTWDNDDVFSEKTDSIKLFKSSDMYMEVERAACKICDLVREEGYRYRDIALICSDEEKYSHLIEPIFGEYGIPYFSDKRELMQNHPIAIQITSLFDMFENGFDYESVFMYLKAGFIFRKQKSQNGYFYTPVPQEEVDELENYVIKYGIRGKKRYLDSESFAKELTIMQAAFDSTKDSAFIKENEKLTELINSLHAELMAPVMEFDKRTKKAQTGEEYAKALFNLIEDINIASGLEAQIYELEKENRVDEAQQYERIWELLSEVTEQVSVTMGDVKMSLEEFGGYIKAGISTCEIRLVPSGIDRVYVGSSQNNTAIGPKVLFAIGATEGTYPNENVSEGFLSDSERDVLNSGKKVMFAKTSSEKLQRENYNVFELFAQPSDYLFISTPVFDSGGAEHECARIVNDIKRKFPNITESDNFSSRSSEERFYISTPQATFHKMLINKSANRDRVNPIWEAVKDYYSENEEYSEKIKLLDGENEFFDAMGNIDSSLAQKLYGEHISYSKSKIDQYAKCPYGFFLHYGLGVKEREEWEISKADLGSYAHEIIEKFCTEVEGDAQTPQEKLENWRSLSDDKRAEILDKIFNDVKERMASSQINRRAQIEHILGRMNKVIDKAAKMVTNCFVHGRYTIKSMENEITVPISESVDINGFIDRLDELDENGRKYIRVIDYKTGASEFNIKNIYNGVDMQMVIYALAAKLQCEAQEGGKFDVAGMYYTKLRGELKSSKQDVEKLRMLDGITFEGDELGSDMLSAMDDSVEEGKSVLLPIKFKKDGTLDKSSAEKVRTHHEGEMLLDFVKDKILEFDDNIRQKGDIRLMPYEGACEYCDYNRICSASGAVEKRPVKGKKLSTADIWQTIVKEQEEKNDSGR